MKAVYRWLVSSMCVLLVACGGGGGDGGSSASSHNISLSESTMAFTLIGVDSQRKQIVVEYDGDGVIVGPPINTTLPGWLYVEEGIGSTPGRAVFSVIVYGPLEPGNYSGQLRFVTGSDEGGIKYRDLTINVESKAALKLNAVSGQLTLPSIDVSGLQFDLPLSDYAVAIDYQWSSSYEGWLSFEENGNGFRAVATTTELPFDQLFGARVTFTAPDGSEQRTAVEYRISRPTLSFEQPAVIVIDNQTTLDELTYTVPVITNSDGIVWSLNHTGDHFSANGSHLTGEIEVAIDPDSFIGLDNQTLTYDLSLEYFFSAESAESDLSLLVVSMALDFAGPSLVSPAVVYAGEESVVRVWGNGFERFSDEQLQALSPVFTAIRRISSNEFEATVDANAAQAIYSLNAEIALGNVLESVSFEVKDHASFPTAVLDLQGRIITQKAVYDRSREALYAVVYVPINGGSTSELIAITHDGSEWSRSLIPVPDPRSAQLVDGGRSLIVGSRNYCELSQVDLESGLVTELTYGGSCVYDVIGFAAHLYNNSKLIVDVNQWSTVYSYPDWQSSPIDLPMIYSPYAQLSDDSTHLIWGSNNDKSTYVYDVRNDAVNSLDIGDNSWNFLENVSISARGERIAYMNRIYDQSYNVIGHLGTGIPSLDQYGGTVAISPDGTLAAYHTQDSGEIHVYDITSDAGAFKLVDTLTIDGLTSLAVDDLRFADNNQSLFVFTADLGNDIYNMHVFDL